MQRPIRMMMIEHDTDGERLAEMRRITSDYRLPAEACPSFTALYAGLQDLERDLHQHIHLENNVLFPAAAELEN
jgi:regulator of cell morphogenesis and NO signaling